MDTARHLRWALKSGVTDLKGKSDSTAKSAVIISAVLKCHLC